MAKLLLINGPNLNRLGKREPHKYGSTTLPELERDLARTAQESSFELQCFQSNFEGAIIDALHEAEDEGVRGIILNPGAYTHYSYAIRDAIAGISVPVIEVHITNVHAREEFRHVSVTAPVTRGQIVGLGMHGYHLALEALIRLIEGEG
ncbi:type II 3-dehydroquinate dehydratase [Peribacillus sp. SCS-37]|uniref:type II 3-dehydroquinate dehydratase n=1 Tax=Paraperibacillus esterisolvens TaxID=3115296 RepID=UPI003906C199